MSMVIDGTNGVTFPNTTVQTVAALPLTGGQLSGNLTFATGTNGIKFNNSGASVNSTLNDYEEGTWTPANVNMSVSGTYSSSGTYTKIGRFVTATAYIAGSTSITGSAGNAISGLPFTVARPTSGSSIQGLRGQGGVIEA